MEVSNKAPPPPPFLLWVDLIAYIMPPSWKTVGSLFSVSQWTVQCPATDKHTDIIIHGVFSIIKENKRLPLTYSYEEGN